MVAVITRPADARAAGARPAGAQRRAGGQRLGGQRLGGQRLGGQRLDDQRLDGYRLDLHYRDGRCRDVRPIEDERPRLVLIPGGRDSTPVRSPAGLRVPAVAPSSRWVIARVAQSASRHRRIIAYGLLALAVVAGLWMVVRAIGGVSGGDSLGPSGTPAAAVAGGPAAATEATSTHPAQGHAWVVQPGETLWGIVEAAGVKGDPRPVVDQLAAQLGGRPLQPGQVVTVP